ncbi:hypothetical protein OG762_00975 [Streptomyces sp. NBC_01136]|nr:hypothetical protein OG762_00975 [Streptomyces sp. NBC_01136]
MYVAAAILTTLVGVAPFDYLSGAHLVALVRAGARFERGRLIERSEMIAA